MASHAPALLLYAALTVALTWPLTVRLGEVVPHDLGDPMLSIWTLWWNAHVTPFTARWWDGLAFFPAPRTLTFSDHRVGIGLFTTPLLLAGASPLAAHNVAFLLTFFLSASAAYALCFVLTKSRAAAFVGGLVFGFNPYRADHLPHLELLSSYWLPIIFLALHRWAATRAGRWLVILGGALLMQALTSGYYFFFAGVLLVGWLLWFAPRDLTWRQVASLAVTLAVPLLIISPVLLEYRRAHTALGLARSIQEIERLSADLIALVTAPKLLALWKTPDAWFRNEGALFPGATAVILIVAALWRGRREAPASASRVTTVRRAFLAAAAVFLGIALIPAIHGPIAFELAGLRVSTRNPYKPLSLAFIFSAAWVLTSPTIRDAWRRQSPLEFYSLATVLLWMFAMGPTARFLGNRILYKAPYSWLMLLPAFRDAFRVPARFAMVAALTLAAAAAVALWKLLASREPRVQRAVVSFVSAAIVAESWISPFPLFDPPPPLPIPASLPADAVIAELPMGAFEDGIAAYHSTMHHRPTLNGLSGYDPPHHSVVRQALLEGALEVLTPIAARAPIAIFVRRDEEGAVWAARVTSRTGARSIAVTDTHEVILLPRTTAEEPVPGDITPIAIRQLTSPMQAENLTHMLDGNRITAWTPGERQEGDEQFTADLGDNVTVTGIVLALGGYAGHYPREVAIDLSSDAQSWSEAWRGPSVTRTITAALRDPRNIGIWFPVAATSARYVRVRQLGQSKEPWSVAELTVVGGR